MPETQEHKHEAGRGCLLCGTVMPLMERMWSEATNDHFRNSRIEFLKGIRSLIDDRINHRFSCSILACRYR